MHTIGEEDGMAAILGRIEFNGKKEEWQSYEERLSHFFEASS